MNPTQIQKPTQIQTINNTHISTKHLDDLWEIKDEWYNYKNINPNITVLLNLDDGYLNLAGLYENSGFIVPSFFELFSKQ